MCTPCRPVLVAMAFHTGSGEVDMQKRFAGFTLIELLVVMSIVALLLTIALPRYFGSLDKAKEVALKENLHLVRATIDKFYADKGRYPDKLEELVEQRYLRSVPVDPMTESAETWLLVPPADAQLGAIYDIKSGAAGLSRGGKPYGEL